MRAQRDNEHPIAVITLAVARVISACTMIWLGSFLIDDHEGVLGAKNTFNLTGVVLSLFWTVLALLSVVGLITKHIWGAPLGCVAIFFAVAAFSLAIPEDPIMAGAFTFSLAYFGAVMTVYTRPEDIRTMHRRLGQVISHHHGMDDWLAKYRKSFSHMVLGATCMALLVFGFNGTTAPWIMQTTLWLVILTGVVSVRFLLLMYFKGDKQHLALFFLTILLLAAGLGVLWGAAVAEALLFLYLCCLYGFLILQTPSLKEAGESFQAAPSLFVLTSFSGLVSMGTLFLYLPDAGATGASIALSDAFFTAISAVCVTGLTVVDVQQDLSLFGQLVVLVLMQVGGLGIMVLSTFAVLTFGGKMGVRTERALSEFIAFRGVKSTYQLIVFIVCATIGIEAVGAIALSYGHLKAGLPLGEAVRLGIFQAVSAFCNAGFSLTGDSLTHLQTSPLMLSCYGLLISLGGLGFVSMFEMIRRLYLGGIRAPLSVQTKIVLWMTLLFLVGGGVLFAALEWTGALAHLSYGHRISNSFFQSVTLRTAGFHSLDITSFGYPAIVIMLLFMFVGGAPGGTAGGVKVTTFSTLMATLPTLMRQDNRVRMFGRTIPMAAVAKGSALIVLSLSTIGVLWFLLLITQPELDPVALLFEVFSAMGTVGLSLGITESLSELGRLIIACGMFVGRVGPLTLAIALGGDSRSKVEYPSADIMIG